MDGTARTLGYAWDRNSSRTRLVHPDGQAFATFYDGLNRPYWMVAEGVNGIASVVYTGHGAPLALNRLGASQAFDYDGVQRPVVRGFLFTAPAGNVTWVHSWNAASGLASDTRYGDDYAWTGAYNADRAYTTNGLNQYATTGQPNTAGSVAFTYDANGNLASETPWGGATTTYTYDIENRLVAVSGPRTAALRYDPLGRLYEVAGNGNTTRFLYDGDALVAEYATSGTLLRRHAHWPGADVPLTTYEGSGFGTVRQLFADRQGSIAAIANHNGIRTAVSSYDEYGIPGAGNTGRFQYTGQIWLAEIGMYHYKARIYSPTLGRFLQTDPVGYEDQINLYAYVGNDPLNLGDSTGLFRDIYVGGVGDNRQGVVYAYYEQQKLLHPGRDILYFEWSERWQIQGAIFTAPVDEPLNGAGHSAGGGRIAKAGGQYGAHIRQSRNNRSRRFASP